MNFVVNKLESSVTVDSEAAIKTSEPEIVAKENDENTSIEEEPELMSFVLFKCPMCHKKNPHKSNVEKHITDHHKIDINAECIKVCTILCSTLYR